MTSKYQRSQVLRRIQRHWRCSSQSQLLLQLPGQIYRKSILRLCIFLAFATLLVASCIEISAQVIDPVVAAQAPVPGVGHHYIGMGAETVNPADGSLTFDLPIQTPDGRGLSFPFGIHFNSSEPFTVTGAWWAPPPGVGPPFSLGGWSYKLPTYVAQAFLIGSHPAMGGCGNPAGNPCPGNETDYCWSTENYNFRGFDGAQHALDIDNFFPDPANPDPPSANPCGQYGTGAYSGNGNNGASASLGTPANNNNQPTLTVAERSGTVYQFPTVAVSPNKGSSTALPFGSLAQSIIDRNGNRITLTSGQSTYSAGSVMGSGSYTDTAGRAIVSWSGLGSAAGDHLGSAAGDQLAVSGLSSITVKWTTTTINIPGGSNYMESELAPVPSGDSPECAVGASSFTMPAVSEIDLPNGQKYSFSYLGSTGQVTQITFPDGGYVKYLWGTNPLSQATYETQPSGQGTFFHCYVSYTTPAIIRRDVYDVSGTHLLTQQFTYNPTNWVYGRILGVPYWTTKNTIVTSTDLISSLTSTINYTYSSVGTFYTENQGTTLLGQVPVEQSVLYQGGSGNTLKTVNKTWLDQFAIRLFTSRHLIQQVVV